MVEEFIALQAIAEVVGRNYVVVQVDSVERLKEDFGIVVAPQERSFLTI